MANMKLGARMLIVLGYINLMLHTKPCSATENADAVVVKFQFVSPADWSAEVISQLRTSTATFVNSYCRVNWTMCGKRFSSLSTSDIVILSEYPRSQRVHSIVSFYVKLSSNGALPKFILREILINNHKQLHNDLLEAAGSSIADCWAFRVAQIDEASVLPPREHVDNLNKIITPAVCGFLLLLFLIVGILECSSRLSQKRLLKRCIEEKVAAQEARGPSPPTFAAVVVSSDIEITA